MGFASCGLVLVTFYALKNEFRALALLIALQVLIIYSVRSLFSDAVTGAVTFSLNTLACVVMPLDTIEKVLQTKDLNYVNYFMHGLGVINGVIWTIYHQVNGSTKLAAANALGLLCEVFLGIACLYAKDILARDHPGVQATRLFADIFFVRPKQMLLGEDK